MYVWFLVIILHVQIAPKSGLMDFVYHGTWWTKRMDSNTPALQTNFA
jgi:hypothetical protein